MNIERLEQNGATILVIEGRLDTTTVPVLDQAFNAAFASGSRNFVWDFEKLTFISSSGLRSVLQALKQTGARDGKFAICSGNKSVMEVFEMSGFKSLLPITPDRDSAIRAVA